MNVKGNGMSIKRKTKYKPMETKLKITEGEWKYEGGDNYSVDIVLSNSSTISISTYGRYSDNVVMTREEMEANAALIAEAGTVANETGLTPRELLERYREAIKVLSDMQEYFIFNKSIDEDDFYSMEENVESIIQKSKQQ